jgi:transposase, IS30 family
MNDAVRAFTFEAEHLYDKNMGYQHIEECERRSIERLRMSGKGVREIARILGRSGSSISTEISENSVHRIYKAQVAERKAGLRRKQSKVQCMKVAMDVPLKEYVLEKMKARWSPELIAGRLKCHEKGITYASTKAIYKFVYSVHGRKVEKYLYAKSHKRKGGPKRGSRKVKLDGRTMIAERPVHIENREEFGHFEGDFMESGKDGTGSILHLVERKTRYPFLSLVFDKRTRAVNDQIARLLAGTDPLSLTLDNDLSFAKHKDMSELLCTPVYFCNPYHSWEKGTVENRNRAVRIDIPKGTDNSTVSYDRLKEIETRLRQRPMKILGFKTPQEAWDIENMKRASQKIAPDGAHDTLKLLSTFTEVGVRLEGCV